MTKADIINEISLPTGIAKKDVAVTVEVFMDSLPEVKAVLKKYHNM